MLRFAQKWPRNRRSFPNPSLMSDFECSQPYIAEDHEEHERNSSYLMLGDGCKEKHIHKWTTKGIMSYLKAPETNKPEPEARFFRLISSFKKKKKNWNFCAIVENGLTIKWRNWTSDPVVRAVQYEMKTFEPINSNTRLNFWMNLSIQFQIIQHRPVNYKLCSILSSRNS